MDTLEARVELPGVDGQPAEIDLAVIMLPHQGPLKDMAGNLGDRRRNAARIGKDTLRVVGEPAAAIERHGVQHRFIDDQQQPIAPRQCPAHAVQPLRQPQRDAPDLDPGGGAGLANAIQQRT